MEIVSLRESPQEVERFTVYFGNDAKSGWWYKM